MNMAINELKRMIEAGELVPKGEITDEIDFGRKESLGMRRMDYVSRLPLRIGVKVTLRKYVPPTYTVVKIMEETALCVPADSKEIVEIPISELVRI